MFILTNAFVTNLPAKDIGVEMNLVVHVTNAQLASTALVVTKLVLVVLVLSVVVMVSVMMAKLALVNASATILLSMVSGKERTATPAKRTIGQVSAIKLATVLDTVIAHLEFTATERALVTLVGTQLLANLLVELVTRHSSLVVQTHSPV